MSIDPKDSHNMMIMLAGMCDKDDLIEMIQNAVDGYKNDPGEETWLRLAAICSMILMKNVQLNTGGDKEPMMAAMDMMKDMREFQDFTKIMKPSKQ